MMAVLPRVLFSLLGGSLVAIALLWLMQWLVLADGGGFEVQRERPAMSFVRLQQDSPAEVRKRELPEPEPPPEPPPPAPPALPMPALAQPLISAPVIDLAVPEVPLNLGGAYLGPVRQGPPDRDFIPLSRLPPRYPYRAQRAGLEGWVRVSFLITEQGEVTNAVVVAAEPKDSFDQAALRAVVKWRFKPRIQDGKPVAVRVEQVVNFKLNGDGK